jgi:hypothetical protein
MASTSLTPLANWAWQGADLRSLLCAKPHLTDMAVELEERRLDLAEKNIYEALRSDDSRRRDAASFFCPAQHRQGQAAGLDCFRFGRGARDHQLQPAAASDRL